MPKFLIVTGADPGFEKEGAQVARGRALGIFRQI